MSYLKIPFLATLVLSCFVSTYSSAQELKDSATGKSFPQSVTIDYEGKQINLEATGVSTRKKFFAKVYSVAHYIGEPSSVRGQDVFANILNSTEPKQLTFIWVRDVGQNKVQDGYRESLGNVLSDTEAGQLKSEIDQYVKLFGNVKTNDQHIMRWLPDGTISVDINGTEAGQIKNERFARALWSLWFGRKSVVKREELVSRIN